MAVTRRDLKFYDLYENEKVKHNSETYFAIFKESVICDDRSLIAYFFTTSN